jgi:hypothetical protein
LTGGADIDANSRTLELSTDSSARILPMSPFPPACKAKGGRERPKASNSAHSPKAAVSSLSSASSPARRQRLASHQQSSTQPISDGGHCSSSWPSRQGTSHSQASGVRYDNEDIHHSNNDVSPPILDCSAFPHIVDLVCDFASLESLAALVQTSKTIRSRIERFLAHFVITRER